MPHSLQAAVAVVLERHGGSQRKASAALRATYRQGGSSREIDLAAYLVSRLPATYAAVAKVLAEVARLRPDLSPASILDVGSGPGTASWAAVAQWPDLTEVTFIDNDRDFLALAGRLATAASHAGLRNATCVHASLADSPFAPRADLVIASYVLAELGLFELARAVATLWRAGKTVVLIEPGTPNGFARLRVARETLLAAGAKLVGPCPHEGACPIAAPDWCHFSVRLPRSRAHMHAKTATVPFEDEKFCWLAVTRTPAALPAARIIAPPRQSKVEIALPLCTPSGLETRHIPRRNKIAYAAARKLDWGDAL